MELLSIAAQRMPRLSLPLTNYQFRCRQFIRTFHSTISQHQRYTRINRPIGLFRLHETPDPLLPPDIFKPENLNQSPEDLFQPLLGTPGIPTSLLYHVNDPTKTLIYIDGASSGNGSPGARAGYGIYRSPKNSLNICRPLPIGTTNNRAELCAAVSALELIAREPNSTDATTSPPGSHGARGGAVDSWIIASDSTYIVMGATDWAWKWRAIGWKRKKKNAPIVGVLDEEVVLGEDLVPNADLWDRLLRGIMNLRGQILFWMIRKQWNQAHGLAQRAAKLSFALEDQGQTSCSDDFRKAQSARGLSGPKPPAAPAHILASSRRSLSRLAEPEEDIGTPLSDKEKIPRAPSDRLPGSPTNWSK